MTHINITMHSNKLTLAAAAATTTMNIGRSFEVDLVFCPAIVGPGINLCKNQQLAIMLCYLL